MGPEARPRLLTSRSLSNEPVPECMNVTERWAGLARVAAGGEQSERQIRLRDPYVVVCGVRVVSTLPVEQEDVHVRLRIGCSAVPGMPEGTSTYRYSVAASFIKYNRSWLDPIRYLVPPTSIIFNQLRLSTPGSIVPVVHDPMRAGHVLD